MIPTRQKDQNKEKPVFGPLTDQVYSPYASDSSGPNSGNQACC